MTEKNGGKIAEMTKDSGVFHGFLFLRIAIAEMLHLKTFGTKCSSEFITAKLKVTGSKFGFRKTGNSPKCFRR